ncbi:MAG: YraN family protein [Pseudomonadales bacterium]|nr:YraN family protein [Pseudomonadales bacterium]
MTTTGIIGARAEQRAADFLTAQGLSIIERNFRCKAGEIDLIVSDNNTLIFVEVRYRQDSSRGSGAETVTRSKIRKLIRTAEFYLLNRPIPDLDLRFDVISVDDTLDWIKNAFTLDDR